MVLGCIGMIILIALFPFMAILIGKEKRPQVVEDVEVIEVEEEPQGEIDDEDENDDANLGDSEDFSKDFEGSFKV